MHVLVTCKDLIKNSGENTETLLYTKIAVISPTFLLKAKLQTWRAENLPEAVKGES